MTGTKVQEQRLTYTIGEAMKSFSLSLGVTVQTVCYRYANMLD